MSNNLFQDLSEFTTRVTPVILQPGERVPNPRFSPEGPDYRPYLNSPAVGTKPIQFMIHATTANEIGDAEALITATAPQIMVEQSDPSGRGKILVPKNYDYENPKYVKEKLSQTPLRDAAICLFGCPALHESTPGSSLSEKAQKLTATVPAAILEWLAGQIGDLTTLTAVGEKEVASFLANGSGASDSGSSRSSSTQSRRPAKKKSSKRKTGQTSNSKSGKLPDSGK